ncbi:MAG: redoxin family protein [Bryobacteraceae bacterium]|jgi:thiol-disulfide isomerase/thioredoxin
MRTVLLCAATFLLFSSLLPGQDLKVGEPAPSLSLDRTIPAGGQPNWESLSGNPVVIEFWATWCGYCIEEIPHLNALAEKYRDVRFISITDEQASLVEPFLAKRPIQGQVALDRNGSTFKAYGIEGRPQTILVDKTGVLRGILYPTQLTEAVMEDFLAGRPLSPVPLRRGLHILEENTVEPSFAVILRPARKKGGDLNQNPGYVQGDSVSLKRILAYAYSTYFTRLEGTSELLDIRYDFCVSVPQGRDDEPLILRDALQRTFNLKAHWEKREVDALVLTAVNPKLRELKSLGPTVNSFAGIIEARLKRYVVDETGLRGYYAIEQPPDDQEIEQFVRDQLGLLLSPAKRTIELLVVDSLELPTVGVTLPGR